MVGEYQNLSKLQIISSLGQYEINFESFKNNLNPNYFYIVDSFFESVFPFNSPRVIYVDSNEENKTLSRSEQILIGLSEMGMTKRDSIVVVGGGCVQDIGTLVASLYMRGVEWIFVPTTLAAMGDSCIGGKSSINAGSAKNLVGNFYPPSRVIIDTSFCASLPNLEMVAGLSEIIKICYARSYEHFSQSIKIATFEGLQDSPDILNELIFLSLSSKKYFIEEDEFDKGIRKLLNFGHSFGHALETASNFHIPHGVAVMVGMIAASHHSASIKTSASLELRSVCLSFLKQVSSEISKSLAEFNIEEFGYALKRDKKNTAEKLVLVLPCEQGLMIFETLFKQGAIEFAQTAMERARTEVLNEIC